MAISSFPDIWAWIQSIPPITQWKTDSMSMSLCCQSSHKASLKISISRTVSSSSVSFSVVVDYNLPLSLWTSKPLKLSSVSTRLLDETTTYNLLTNIIEDVLQYCPIQTTILFKLPRIDSVTNLKAIFSFSFLTLLFIICIYESPADLRSSCLNSLKNQLSCPMSREVSKYLMNLLGSNTEEQWIRSLNLAITNWIVELQASRSQTLKTPSPLFSYAVSRFGLWKVQLFCPVIAMDVEKSSHPQADERLLFSLNYHQVEGVIQLNHEVIIREKWIDVIVNTDNIRCNVIRLLNETLMTERGAGTSEKHFPSRISLQLTPTLQANVLSISVSKSSANPVREIGIEKTIEGAFNPPSTLLALKVSSGETVTTSLKPWKFEQSVYGNSVILNWFLHDSLDGREVFSSKPSKFSLIHPKSWFKNRYSSAYRPFSRQGGVIFAGDEYGESVCWKVDKGAMGKTMDWEIKGWIWLTYWPNKYRTFYTETRKVEFREILHLTLAN